MSNSRANEPKIYRETKVTNVANIVVLVYVLTSSQCVRESPKNTLTRNKPRMF